VFALVLVSALTASAATMSSGSGGSFLSNLIGWIFGAAHAGGNWGDGTPNNTRGGWGDGTNNNS
jgi:hypothetical protein